MSQRDDFEAYEPTDWEARPIKAASVALAVFIALALGASALTVKLVKSYRAQTDEPAVFDLKKGPPPPRLQPDPSADMAAFRRRENAILSSYGWIDKQRGVARIPIDRAIEIVAREHGGAR